MTEPRRIRLLLVDDHMVVRRGLTELMEGADEIEVIGSAADGEEAVALALEEKPDLVLMDISMPGMDGIEATRRIAHALPDTRIVMLTSMAGHERIVDALRAGATSYVLKDADPEDVLIAVRQAARSAGVSEVAGVAVDGEVPPGAAP